MEGLVAALIIIIILLVFWGRDLSNRMVTVSDMYRARTREARLWELHSAQLSNRVRAEEVGLAALKKVDDIIVPAMMKELPDGADESWFKEQLDPDTVIQKFNLSSN